MQLKPATINRASSEESAYDFFDDFNGSLATFATGRTPDTKSNGNTWSVTGAGAANARINGSGAFTMASSGSNAYAVMKLGGAVWEVGGTFQTTNIATWCPTMAIVNNYPGNGFNEMLHLNLSINGSGVLTFTPGIWTGGLTNDPFSHDTSQAQNATLAANTAYRYRAIVNGNFITLIIENATTGAPIICNQVCDSRVSGLCADPYVFFELGADTTTQWLSAYARLKPSEPSLTMHRAICGIEGSPIGQNVRAPGVFSSLWVGPLSASAAPKARFGYVYDGTAADAPGVFSSASGCNFIIKPLAAGNTGSLTIYNGNGNTATISHNGSVQMTFADNAGNVWLTGQPNGNMPFFNGGLRFTSASGPYIYSNSGSPEGVYSAPVGSLYLRTDGGASTTLYVKTSGTGNTGWTAK